VVTCAPAPLRASPFCVCYAPLAAADMVYVDKSLKGFASRRKPADRSSFIRLRYLLCCPAAVFFFILSGQANSDQRTRIPYMSLSDPECPACLYGRAVDGDRKKEKYFFLSPELVQHAQHSPLILDPNLRQHASHI